MTEHGKIMAATEPADVATMAMIETMRQIADNGRATNEVLTGMQAELRDVRERVIRIEASEFKTELRALKVETERIRKEDLSSVQARLTALELLRAEQNGATGMVGTILKSPTLGWLVGAAITAWAILTGKVAI